MSNPARRRDNGLQAQAYQRLGDVQTHLVDDALDRLRDAGVAAYSAPSPGVRGPYGEMVPPVTPSDGVWVDSTRHDEARRILDSYLAEVAADVAWAGIVAEFDREPLDVVPRWPAAEDVDPDDEEHDGSDRALRPRPVWPGGADTHAVGAPSTADEDHYVPEPPPPLPEIDRISRFAWAGALGGPLLLLLATLAGIPLAGWVGALAVAAFVAGFVTLVARMPDRPPPDSGPDDGAVV